MLRRVSRIHPPNQHVSPLKRLDRDEAGGCMGVHRDADDLGFTGCTPETNMEPAKRAPKDADNRQS